MADPDLVYRCWNGHYTRTIKTDYRICTARSHTADGGAFGPECGEEVESVTIDITHLDELLSEQTHLIAAARSALETLETQGGWPGIVNVLRTALNYRGSP